MNLQDLISLDPSSRATVDIFVNDTINSVSDRIYSSIRHDIFSVMLKKYIWEILIERNCGKVDSGNLLLDVSNIFEESGLKEVISAMSIRIFERNKTINLKDSPIENSFVNSRKAEDEQLDYIRDARRSWEQGISEELFAISHETSRPFVKYRPDGVENPFLHQNLFSNENADNAKFLYDCEDFLEAAIAIRNPNLSQAETSRMIGLIKLPLPTPTLEELTLRFLDLSPHLPQFGIDDLNHQWGSKYCILKQEDGDILSLLGNPVDARKYLSRGCPPSLRHKLWRVAFGLSDAITESEVKLFDKLSQDTHKLDLVTDEILLCDVQTITDDPRFFVFEDELREVSLAFSRDDWVRFNADYEIHELIQIQSKPNNNNNLSSHSTTSHLNSSDISSSSPPPSLTSNSTSPSTPSITIPSTSPTPPSPIPPSSLMCVPPSAVQPFLGLASTLAPLCYVCRSKPELLSLWKHMYVRIWCRLHVLSSNPQTYLTFLKTFENILITLLPKVYFHLLKISFSPLHLVSEWIQTGFFHLLECDQILLLWDRLIGCSFDPMILVLFAISIFVYRSELILSTTTSSEVLMMLTDGSRLKVVPLLQMLLFSDPHQHTHTLSSSNNTNTSSTSTSSVPFSSTSQNSTSSSSSSTSSPILSHLLSHPTMSSISIFSLPHNTTTNSSTPSSFSSSSSSLSSSSSSSSPPIVIAGPNRLPSSSSSLSSSPSSSSSSSSSSIQHRTSNPTFGIY